MLAGLWILGGFASLITADLTVNLLPDNGVVVTGRLTNFLLISLPSCDSRDQSVDVEYQNMKTNQNKTLSNVFVIPNCQSSSSSSSTNPLTVQRGIGYQLTGLSNNTEYKIRYRIGTTYSNYLTANTRSVSNLNSIDDDLPGRSAAMIVITATLSVAMFFLLLGFILSLVLSNN